MDTVLDVLTGAYRFMLQVKQEPLRAENQETYAKVRDTVADLLGMPPATIQAQMEHEAQIMMDLDQREAPPPVPPGQLEGLRSIVILYHSAKLEGVESYQRQTRDYLLSLGERYPTVFVLNFGLDLLRELEEDRDEEITEQD